MEIPIQTATTVEIIVKTIAIIPTIWVLGILLLKYLIPGPSPNGGKKMLMK